MKINLQVTYTDGRKIDVNVKPKGLIAFERQYGVGLPSIGDTLKYEYLAYMAWITLHLAGDEPASFDDWLTKLEDVAESEGDADPFPQEASDASSAG